MKLHVINPNTSEGMTEVIRRSALAAAGPGTEIVCHMLPRGPEWSDCAYDNVLVAYEVVKMIQEDEQTGVYDGYVIASFSDPALDAVKELTRKPVVGIAEAALHFSALLGYKFSVINSIPRVAKNFDDNIRRVGAMDRLASVKLPAYKVTDFLNDVEEAKKMLLVTGREAIEKDGAEVLILGGGMLAGYSEYLSEALGVPVLDAIKCGVKLAEALVSLGLGCSKVNTYSRPGGKLYVD